MIFIYMFTLTNVELFRSLFVFGIRVGGRGRFCRSVKENLTGPFQAPRSDGIKPGIGIERKNIPTFVSVNMYIIAYA